MHFLHLFLAASCFAIVFSLPNALSPLDPAIGSSKQQSQVSLDSRRLANDRIISGGEHDINFSREFHSGGQTTKQSSLKLQKRSGSFQSLPAEMIERILTTAMNFMYQARIGAVPYTWCEVLCMAVSITR